MVKVLFVCLGNVCRSPMAEFVMRDMVEKEGLSGKIETASAATSREESGNPVHYGTRKKLHEVGISTEGKYARKMTAGDYSAFDLLIGMDSSNIRDMKRICGGDPEHKIIRMLDLTNHPRDIADPWYTGNFDVTYDDIVEGCKALLEHLKSEGR